MRTWFDAALACGNAAGAWAAAHELGQLDLADALALCLLLREQQPALYDRAAARWAARFALEAHAVRPRTSGLAVAALHALNGAERDAGIQALASLCGQQGGTTSSACSSAGLAPARGDHALLLRRCLPAPQMPLEQPAEPQAPALTTRGSHQAGSS